jgi:hypothetical protein
MTYSQTMRVQTKLLGRLLAAIGTDDPFVEVGRSRGFPKQVWKTWEDDGLVTSEGRCVTQTWIRLNTGAEIKL